VPDFRHAGPRRRCRTRREGREGGREGRREAERTKHTGIRLQDTPALDADVGLEVEGMEGGRGGGREGGREGE